MSDVEKWSFDYDLEALQLEYKTTCDALKRWPGGDYREQVFLEQKKTEIFRILMERNLSS